jgi:hypothetical protein
MVGTFVIASGAKIHPNAMTCASLPSGHSMAALMSVRKQFMAVTRQYSHPVTGICGHRITVCLQYGAAVVIEKSRCRRNPQLAAGQYRHAGLSAALGLRMVLPLVFSVVLSNGLGLVAASMFYIGCARFLAGPAMPGHWPCWCCRHCRFAGHLPCCWTACRCGW